MTLNVPSSPNIFKGSIDSPPLFVQSPSGKWFAAFPIESRGHSGKLYGLVDEVEGELVPTKVYLNLGGNEKTFHEGEEEFTLGLNVQEKSKILTILNSVRFHMEKFKDNPAKIIHYYGFFGSSVRSFDISKQKNWTIWP
eukprot:GHVP01067401.1.p1 GENE.GHVP01067401.1~~GHVP01067401.1.p1  ORF type:complete len:161 (+),score=25.25 GHVP01067401.1:69-485(+)